MQFLSFTSPKKYLNLSNNFYLKKLPNLSEIDYKTYYLRLTGLYIKDINYLTNLKYLEKLNISFTYVKNLPQMNNLNELQMIEVELDDFNDLNKCKNLTKLKLTHDDFDLKDPHNSLEILHCSILYRPDLLHKKFPNLKEVRFEHIHPKIISSQNDQVNKYYQNLIYKCCLSSKSIIQTKENKIIEDFEDELDEEFKYFNLNNYIKEFSEGRLEYIHICKNLSHLVKYNIYTMRENKVMNIYDNNKLLIKSFEKTNDLNENLVKETINDEKFVIIKDHYKYCYLYRDEKMDEFDSNIRKNIIKRIIYNDYKLNDEIISQLENFEYEFDDDFSIDKLFKDIKENGLTEQLIKKVKFFDKTRKNEKFCEEKQKEPKNIIENSNSIDYYELEQGVGFKELEVDNIKDILWFAGKKYLLTDKQKNQFVDIIKELNSQYNQDHKNIIYARFDNNHQIIHFKLDQEGNEIIIDKPNSELSDNSASFKRLFPDLFDSSDLELSDDSTSIEQEDEPNLENNLIKNIELRQDAVMMLDNNSNQNLNIDNNEPVNIVQVVQFPEESYRNNYVPKKNIFNNIFLDDAAIICDDLDLNITNIDDVDNLLINNKFLNITEIPNRNTSRFHLNFYGRPANFRQNLIENSNGFIMLGTSSDEGNFNHIEALLDKNKDHMSLELYQIYFIFKNRMYTNFLSSDDSMIDYSDDIVVLNDGSVGWGGTFYPFDVILEPHPKLILNKDIGIGSPIKKTNCHNRVYKCCQYHNL